MMFSSSMVAFGAPGASLAQPVYMHATGERDGGGGGIVLPPEPKTRLATKSYNSLVPSIRTSDTKHPCTRPGPLLVSSQSVCAATASLVTAASGATLACSSLNAHVRHC